MSGELKVALTEEVKLQKSAEGYKLLAAALAVCLIISVAFNYCNVSATGLADLGGLGGLGKAVGGVAGKVSGREKNMRSEVKAAIASMTRA